MRFESNFLNRKRFETPPTREEIEAAKRAAEKIIMEAESRKQTERLQKEREEQARIRINEQLSREADIYKLSDEDLREAEAYIKKLEQL